MRYGSATCECGAEYQIIDHAVTTRPIYCYHCGNRGLITMDENLVSWLISSTLQLGSFFFSSGDLLYTKKKHKIGQQKMVVVDKYKKRLTKQR